MDLFFVNAKGDTSCNKEYYLQDEQYENSLVDEPEDPDGDMAGRTFN